MFNPNRTVVVERGSEATQGHRADLLRADGNVELAFSFWQRKFAVELDRQPLLSVTRRANSGANRSRAVAQMNPFRTLRLLRSSLRSRFFLVTQLLKEGPNAVDEEASPYI